MAISGAQNPPTHRQRAGNRSRIGRQSKDDPSMQLPFYFDFA